MSMNRSSSQAVGTRRRSVGLSFRFQEGVGLIEVLIAVLVLGIGLLGIAAMQATALRNSQSSLERTQAVIQTYAILDAMRANLAEARIGSYDMGMTCTAPAGGSLVADDKKQWIESLHKALNESACGSIDCDSESCEISVEWDDSRGTGDKAPPFVTRTKL